MTSKVVLCAFLATTGLANAAADTSDKASDVGAAAQKTTTPRVMLGELDGSCPEGYSHITSLAECRVAIDLVHHTQSFNGVERVSDWPRGCYHCSGGSSSCGEGPWFNKHDTGSPNAEAKPYCAKDFSVEQGKLLFIGDSDIDYWNTGNWSPDSYNIGIGGRTCYDVLKENRWMLKTFQPSRIVLVCGENDLANRKSPRTTFNRFRALFHVIKKAGVPVVMVGTKPEPDTTNLHRKYQRYDRLVMQHAKRKAKHSKEGVPLVWIDSYKGFMEMGNAISLYDADMLHLSPQGYSHWEGWVQGALADTTNCVIWRNGACVHQKPESKALLL